MLKYGQLVVAVSRTVNKKRLRIINFTEKLKFGPPESITTFLARTDIKCIKMTVRVVEIPVLKFK